MRTCDETSTQGRGVERVAEASRLADAYARDRTARGFFIVNLVAVTLFIGLWGGVHFLGSYLKGRDEAILVLIVGIMVLVVGAALLVTIDPGRFLQRLSQRLFKHDGEVHARFLPSLIPQWAFVLACVAFGACLVTQIVLMFLDYLPSHRWQPVSAIYAVPFMVALGLWRRTPSISPVMALWPVLYAAHAILVTAGVPLFDIMDGQSQLFMATFGYGAAIGFLAYVHSRVMLRELRKLTGYETTGSEA